MSLRRFGLALIASLALGCGASSAPLAASTVKAGSMARFIAHGGFLYALDRWELVVYRAAQGASPEKVATVSVPADAETLFPYDELLFVGTRQGMLVYDLQEPAAPKLLGNAAHVYSCDPVVVDKDIAYVTLRAESACRGGINALLVFDVSNPTLPKEIARQEMASPHGLGVDMDMLFIADKTDGLLVLDVRDPKAPKLIARAPDIAGYDVIAHAGVLYVSADNGLYQYAYGPEGITRKSPLSRIPIGAQLPVQVIADPIDVAAPADSDPADAVRATDPAEAPPPPPP